MNVQEPVNVIYQTIISVKSLCFSSIVISTDALAYIILGHEEKNTMTFLSDKKWLILSGFRWSIFPAPNKSIILCIFYLVLFMVHTHTKR